MTKRRLTVEEGLAQLATDPEYQRAIAEREAEVDSRAALVQAAEQPILADLVAVGIQAESVADLIERPQPAAVGILVQHLLRPHSADVRNILARALAVPEARQHWDVLREQYKQERDPWVKDSFAVALAAAAGSAQLHDLIELIRDPSLGESRALLVEALLTSSDEAFQTALGQLRGDESLGDEIQQRLKSRRRQAEPRPVVTQQSPVRAGAETSISIDHNQLPLLLDAVAVRARIPPLEVEKLLSAAAGAERESETRLTVRVGGSQERAHVDIVLFVDDYGALDVYFLGPDDAITQIRQALDSFVSAPTS